MLTLLDREMPAGNYREQWNGIDAVGSTVASGVYFIKMQAGRFTSIRKMILMR